MKPINRFNIKMKIPLFFQSWAFRFCIAKLRSQAFYLVKGLFFLGCISLVPLIATEKSEKCKSEVSASSDEKRIDFALASAFPSLTRNEITLSPLLGGYSAAKNFLLKAAGKLYALRLQKNSESPDKLNRELYMMQQAAELGIAPALFYIAPDNKCFIMEFIEGGTLTFEKAQDILFVKHFGKTISKLHKIPRKITNKDMTFMEAMEKFYLEFAPRLVGYEEPALALAALRLNNAKLKEIGAPKVNIHGDLNPRNILPPDGKIFLIDWSESLWEDPFHDLAFFAILVDYDENRETLLLQSYLDHLPTPDELKRYYICKKMQFARLCLGAYYIVEQRIRLHGETVDKTQLVKRWSDCAKLFAGGGFKLTAQYFYESAHAAFLEMQ